MLSKITENTLVPLSLVIALGGAGVFVTKIHFQQEAMAKEIEAVSSKQEKLEQIAIDIAVMREKLVTIERIIKENQ
jgi:hypothetical protein